MQSHGNIQMLFYRNRTCIRKKSFRLSSFNLYTVLKYERKSTFSTSILSNFYFPVSHINNRNKKTGVEHSVWITLDFLKNISYFLLIKYWIYDTLYLQILIDEKVNYCRIFMHLFYCVFHIYFLFRSNYLLF